MLAITSASSKNTPNAGLHWRITSRSNGSASIGADVTRTRMVGSWPASSINCESGWSSRGACVEITIPRERFRLPIVVISASSSIRSFAWASSS